MRLEQNRQRIETTKLARELAEQRLDAEQRRFEVGMSTSFLVIQAQRDLAIARNSELQALLDYQLAVIAFETAQQTSLRLPAPRREARAVQSSPRRGKGEGRILAVPRRSRRQRAPP